MEKQAQFDEFGKLQHSFVSTGTLVDYAGVGGGGGEVGRRAFFLSTGVALPPAKPTSCP